MASFVTPRNQPPVPPERRPERPHRLSMTWLQFLQRCKHSALLHIEYKGGATSNAMDRGSVAHVVGHRLTGDAIEHGDRFDGEMAKAALAEVYAEGRYTVPAREWDWLRVCCFHFGRHVVIDPDEVLGVEQLIVWDLGEWRISMRVDLALAINGGQTVGVDDYKTQRNIPTQEEFDHSLQCVLYALGLAYGKPVTVTPCDECDATGLVGDGECPDCNRGYIETVEAHSLGAAAQFFRIRELYLGILWDKDEPTEHIAFRERTLTRAELLDEKLMVEGLLASASHAFDTGEWPAVPGDDQCGKCPARRACPLPALLLPAPGSIETADEAEHYAVASFFLEQEKKDVDKALKAWNADHGPIPLGDYEYDVAPERKTTVNREQLAADIAAGKPRPFEEYVTVSHSNRFMRRKRSEQAKSEDAVRPSPGSSIPGPSASPAEDVEGRRDAAYGESLPV